jgi:hypothetical protein
MSLVFFPHPTSTLSDLYNKGGFWVCRIVACVPIKEQSPARRALYVATELYNLSNKRSEILYSIISVIHTFGEGGRVDVF